jgi:hypothetical protein
MTVRDETHREALARKHAHIGPREGTAAYLDQHLNGLRDSQWVTTRCDCGWTHEGLSAEGRAAAVEHRRDAHPERGRKKRRRT